MFLQVTKPKFQLAVQEFNSAMEIPPRGQGMQNLQIREKLQLVVRELATCADLMVPSIQTLAASKPSLQRLRELSQNGGYFTMNRGLTVVDYGNWQYTTLLKAVQMLSTDISAAVLSISSHSGATTLEEPSSNHEILRMGSRWSSHQMGSSTRRCSRVAGIIALAGWRTLHSSTD